MSYKDQHKHIPRAQPIIPEDSQRAASRFLAEVAAGMHDDLDPRVLQNRVTAAKAIIQLGQTQDRYSPERVAEMAKLPKASEAIRKLDALTPEELARLETELTAGYPGKPA